MTEDFVWFVGMDWATDRHQACLIDRDGAGREQREIEHTAEGVQGFVNWLQIRTNEELHRVAVAIESARGALVDTLIELGLAVFAINPKQLDRFRDRHTVARAKDDRRDALVLADSLRTDRPAFRRVQVDHPLVIQIRALSRAEDDLQIDLGRLTNRVREQVYRLAPGLLTLCPGTPAQIERGDGTHSLPSRADRASRRTFCSFAREFSPFTGRAVPGSLCPRRRFDRVLNDRIVRDESDLQWAPHKLNLQLYGGLTSPNELRPLTWH